jgi:hypothetical protein
MGINEPNGRDGGNEDRKEQNTSKLACADDRARFYHIVMS